MSVVSSKVIFCEGKETSLDFRLLNRVVENVLTNKPTIVPSGGKFTFSVFVQGYFSRDSARNQQYIIFRDRDFDAKPTTDIKLLRLNSMLLTHCACVENYLLNADLIHNYWNTKYIEKLNNPTSRWGHGDSPSVEIISAWIEDAARSIQDYQSVRWALADLLQSSANRHQLETTWTPGSGNLPNSLTLSDCKKEAVALINEFQQAVGTVTQDRFEQSLAVYQEQFTQESFWTQKHYLIWFHGKDMQKAMQRQKSQYIALKHFFNWAVEQIDINQYPDLVELQNLISAI